MALGLSAAEARAEAHRRFGSVHQARRALRRSARTRDLRMKYRDWLDGGKRSDQAISTIPRDSVASVNYELNPLPSGCSRIIIKLKERR